MRPPFMSRRRTFPSSGQSSWRRSIIVSAGGGRRSRGRGCPQGPRASGEAGRTDGQAGCAMLVSPGAPVHHPSPPKPNRPVPTRRRGTGTARWWCRAPLRLGSGTGRIGGSRRPEVPAGPIAGERHGHHSAASQGNRASYRRQIPSLAPRRFPVRLEVHGAALGRAEYCRVFLDLFHGIEYDTRRVS